MKRFPLLMVALILLAAAFNAYAYRDEPNGFRGFKWGDSIKTAKSQMAKYISLHGPEPIVLYKRKNDALKMGPADLSGIYYGYWRGKLISVQIDMHSRANFEMVRDVCFAKFGPVKPKNVLEDEYSWIGVIDTDIELKYDRIHATGTLLLSAKWLYSEYNNVASQKARDGAKKDW